MIYLYNGQFRFFGKAKALVKKISGRNLFTGPQAVFASLQQGLKELNIPFGINQWRLPESARHVAVLSGIGSLKWAIRQKQRKKIVKLAAGPNLVVSPEEQGGIITHPLIDKVIVPSPWVKEFYLRKAPGLQHKIFIWPAGVDVPAKGEGDKKFDILIFNKIGQSELFARIVGHLKAQGLRTQVVEYGRFRQWEYFALLSQSNFVVYLSGSESQGLSMLEAWAAGVPTLAWEKGEFIHNHTRVTGYTATPYLDPQSGMRFKDFAEFQRVLPIFLSTKFSSQEYVLRNFTYKICAQKFLDIINA